MQVLLINIIILLYLKLNASSIPSNSTTDNSLYIKPIRYNNSFSGGYSLRYNNTTGEITYDTGKTFVIQHPIEDDKYLVHACLEGPEAGVYYRGKGKIDNNNFVKINLPDYVSIFAYDFNIQLTPIYNGNKTSYYATEIINNSFDVYGDNGEFYWVVFGKRNDINIEPNKYDVNVKGNGPYLWI